MFTPVDSKFIMVNSEYLLGRCQKKFSTQEFLFIPAQVYIAMMEISAFHTFDKEGPGTLLWETMNYCLSDPLFANSDAGALTRIACFMKRPVEVRPDLAMIYDKKDAIVTCSIENLLIWFNSSDREIVDWEIEVCFIPYLVQSRRGKLSELSRLFIELGNNFVSSTDPRARYTAP